MSLKICEQNKNIIILEITVDKKTIKEEYFKSVKKMAKNVNIPGFRKGKTPINILEKHIDEKIIINDMKNSLLKLEYTKAIKEKNIKPINYPEIEIISIGKNVPFIFKAKVEVVPEGKLGIYKGIKLEKEKISIEEEDIEREIESLREKHAKLEIIDTKVEKGDIVTIDFTGYIEEKPFKGGEAKNYQLEIGSNMFIPGFEEKLIGSKKLEEKNINIVFPKNYHVENLKNKNALFKVKINEIKRKKLLKLDDDFVKDISEFDTLNEFKLNIRQKLISKKKKNIENLLRNKALEKCINDFEIEIPEIMIKEKIEEFLINIKNDIARHNMTIEQYYETTGMSEEKIKNDYKPVAIKHIKKDILLDSIVKKENIIVSNEDIDFEISKISKSYNQKEDDLKKYFKDIDNLNILKTGIAREKAIKIILDSAEIKDKK